VRYGYRRIHVLLWREGWQMNIKKTRRIYNELGLQLRNKHPKRRVKAKLREDRQEAAGPNEVWAMDFANDQLALGKKLRIPTIVDLHSRYCPAVDPWFAYRGEDVVQTLERVCRQIGYPQTIRVDNGSEVISRELDLWAYAHEVTLDFSRPGKPTDNGFIEAFNSKLQAECLNAHWFMDLADAREKLEAWRKDYNEVRPHSAIGYNVPIDQHIPGGAPVTKAATLQRAAVQIRGAEQKPENSAFELSKVGHQMTPMPPNFSTKLRLIVRSPTAPSIPASTKNLWRCRHQCSADRVGRGVKGCRRRDSRPTARAYGDGTPPPTPLPLRSRRSTAAPLARSSCPRPSRACATSPRSWG